MAIVNDLVNYIKQQIHFKIILMCIKVYEKTYYYVLPLLYKTSHSSFSFNNSKNFDITDHLLFEKNY